MSEALVSAIIQQLTTILFQQAEHGIRLVVSAKDDVEKLHSNFLAIKAVLEDAERKQVKEHAVRDWLNKLKQVSYDIDDVLDEWNTTIQKLKINEVENASKPLSKVRSLVSYYSKPIALRPDIALKIKNLSATLDVISTEKNRFKFDSLVEGRTELERPMTTSIIDLSKVFGRYHDKKTLVNLLMNESSQAPNLYTISIVGMGGIGKTTLARLVFNDEEIKTHFDFKIWVYVSDPFDEIRIAKAILESLTGHASTLGELETIVGHIHQKIERKKCFFVLDDVWIEESTKWEQLENVLKCGARGSRIVVTTRKEVTAKIMGSTKTNIISLGKLPDEESWSLFSQVALSERSNDEIEMLENIGRKIVGKCNGLPLAVKTLASLLSSKTRVEQWESVLNSELWKLEEIEKRLFPPILLSYFDLPSILRKCFSYCAIFPKDFKLEKEKLIKLWMAQDYLKVDGREDMETIGEEYFENLAMRSFFQDCERSDFDGSIISCKMHDIVHDFAQFLTKNECFNVITDDLRKAQHSMIENNEIKLRSLVLDLNSHEPIVVSSKLFDQFTCLRTLDSNYSGNYVEFVENIPKKINKLIHLRYLSLAGESRLDELPEALCDLYNLQTLNICNCLNLRRLPERIGKLINLRHLINNGCINLKYMPKGMERLICLRTLSYFVVSGGGVHGRKASTLKCLSNLNQLQGDLMLSRLGNRRDIGDQDEQVELLKSKMKLLFLTLEFDDVKSINEHEAVLELLQPPPSLERLTIWRYQGSTISPLWMQSLQKLRELDLSSCKKWKNLPSSLAKLPTLESLTLENMTSIKRVGNEFLGAFEEAPSSLSSSSIIVFPKLKYLQFSYMGEWEEWDCNIPGETDITIMPSLLELSISRSKKLKELPDYILRSTTLQKLIIWHCTNLANLYGKGTTEDWLKISCIPNIQIDGQINFFS